MSLALIRFVNSLLDPLQKKDKSLSLSALAANIGLPAAFVEIRHWGTHEANLPGSEVLRDMGIRALDWLWTNYWNKQEEKTHFLVLWKNGAIGFNEVISSFQKKSEESFENLVVELSEEEDFGLSRKIWDPLLSSLITALPTFLKTFLEYVVDTLVTIPQCIVPCNVANGSSVAARNQPNLAQISFNSDLMDNPPSNFKFYPEPFFSA